MLVEVVAFAGRLSVNNKGSRSILWINYVIIYVPLLPQFCPRLAGSNTRFYHTDSGLSSNLSRISLTMFSGVRPHLVYCS